MKSKKGLLSSGIAVISAAVPMLVNGTYLEGGILAVIGVGLVLAYDHLDDNVKGTPQLPEGVDEEWFKEVAAQLADEASNADLPDQLQSDGDSSDR
ncbi:hypothetical protein PN419_00250 [Halorubrum ezzemoulense]|uniref:hypothetical protein n=1 Tax=Halorubrum ezzemoulense TaxID=337243 RepID=UPI00232B65A4|nr:hypothetical protein [Halorubrum ezzemoulense]MDB9247437.1 hypothetical protein [Halorubrum ezzemoulense]MDB9258654.1 hypothetical protein [Halorubrum ezzemoulense]MDB9264488.1 hypothetical protein [Halorubrum ezzemoulense]MDB9269015.1 hypothetical protein [Halorubrum ezzemoulense]MDB9271456.1 hypothetical protein [Halorubrum ezzemoulense]